MLHRYNHDGNRGFTLAEVLVAVVLLAVMAGGLASLVAHAARSLARARAETLATELARSRLDQLLSLPWGYGSPYAPTARTDSTTDLSASAPAGGGTGLSVPAGSLDANVPSFVDHLDSAGRWLGNTTTAPAGARFTRRWQVGGQAGHPGLLVIRVGVIDLRREHMPVTVATLRMRTSG